MTEAVLGIIGGSGVYDIPGLENPRWLPIESPWGQPSDAILFAEFQGLKLRFLPRHGRGHRLAPNELNFRANIDVLKRAGVTDLISISAVGSLREHLAPGTFVLPDQYIDRTHARPASFFGGGIVGHVGFAEPVSARLRALVAKAAGEAGVALSDGGTLVVIEGPQFSTRAESEMYRTLKADIIGMTAMPEAKLAREAELPYATVAMVTDYDAWHPHHEAVDVQAVVATLHANRDKAQALVSAIARGFPRQVEDDPARTALDHAFMTAPEARPSGLMSRLDAVAGRVLGNANGK
ncbi:S-methyl-5'-thioadenosine phosphorylase [Youhaiella tibetensis]|uniref:S-methyl-5'-thioadenosine phosphorylase n=1 Tax=Paradevosia tibetensis TaxID=1447062 RepID=A0A5B9DRB9_9HYPH|nr:S-methyl-5'-thioadenosine phosphorylase [Youhaiella tibetensis]QEE21612.1 S-methyl-5'-thioadenosine phosphorylase [Youhaiella tibetensis]GGF13302.1 S-methyl-5'-thioadenosine phosphorylase [Youhaiella tibetensis]